MEIILLGASPPISGIDKVDRAVSLSCKGHPNFQTSRVLSSLPGLRNIT
jgi:hypothetical protein